MIPFVYEEHLCKFISKITMPLPMVALSKRGWEGLVCFCCLERNGLRRLYCKKVKINSSICAWYMWFESKKVSFDDLLSWCKDYWRRKWQRAVLSICTGERLNLDKPFSKHIDSQSINLLTVIGEYFKETLLWREWEINSDGDQRIQSGD